MKESSLTDLDRQTLQVVWTECNRKLLSRRQAEQDSARVTGECAGSLTSAQVEQLRLRREAGQSMASLAREFKITCDSLYVYCVRRW